MQRQNGSGRHRTSRGIFYVVAALVGLGQIALPALAEPAPQPALALHGVAAARMPADIDAYIELHDPAQVAALLPLTFIGPQGQQFSRALELLAGANVSLGIDTRSEQAILVIDSTNGGLLGPLADEGVRILGDLARQLQTSRPNDPAATDDQPQPIPPPDIKAGLSRFGRLTVARLDGQLLISTEPAWIDQALATDGQAPQKIAPDGAEQPAPAEEAPGAETPALAEDATFRAAAEAIRPEAPAWLFIRPSALAKLLTGEGFLVRAGQQFPVLKEMLGGLLLPASQAPYLAFELGQREGQLEISLVLPEELRDADGDLRLLVAALDDDAQAFAPLLPRDTVLSVSAAVSHDAVALLNRLLLNPERLEKLAETSPNAASLLQGLPLIEKILAEVQPQMQLVVVKQPAPASDRPQAELRLPAAAIIFHPHNAQEVKTAFITTYLGSIRNANVQAKAAGRPTYTLHSERRGDALVTGAVYRQLKDDPQPGRLDYNLSPSMAVIGDRYVISTNLELAQELADLAQNTPQTLEPSNLRVDVGSAALMGVLAENLPALMQGRQGPAESSETPLVDLAAGALRRFMERLPAEPRALGKTTRVPWRVRMRARFGRL